jgi:hypothetical protein
MTMPSTRHADRRLVRGVATAADAAETKIAIAAHGAIGPDPMSSRCLTPSIRINNWQLLISSDTSIGNDQGYSEPSGIEAMNMVEIAMTSLGLNSVIWSGSPFWEIDHETI